MANVVPIRATGALTRRDPRRIALFKNTVGRELAGSEVDEALEWCEIFGANPFVRDIFFFVFKDKDGSRKLTPVLSIQMYRKIASRTGNYRPDEHPARFTYDVQLIGPANPKGIVDCELSVFKFMHGAWHPTTERLKWEERAPIKSEGADGFKWEETGEKYPPGHAKAGKPKFRKVQLGERVDVLDPGKQNWHTMPETMLSKCVEAAAIRKAWPNETAGSYVAEEMDSPRTIEATAVEIAEKFESDLRLKQIGANNSILIDWLDNAGIVQTPVGKLGDMAIEWCRKNAGEPMTVHLWTERNRHALKEYWGRDKAGALALKQVIEPILKLAAE